MRSKQKSSKSSAERVVKDIRRQTRKHYSAEEKIRIVLEGLRGDDTIAEPTRPWRTACSKKHDRGWGRRRMRHPASENLEIIRLVEKSQLPVKQTLDRPGIAQPTFYCWHDLYQRFGEDTLEGRRPGPRPAWNRIPDKVQAQILDMAPERCELSPRELESR